MSTNPFVDPNLTQDDIPEADLMALGRLAGEAIREETRRMRAAGTLPPAAPASKPLAPIATSRSADEDTLTR